MAEYRLSRQRILNELPSERVNTKKLTPGYLVLEGGALCGVPYVAGRVGDSIRFNVEHARDPEFIGLAAKHKEHSLISWLSAGIS